jgi:integrase/recombinase XerD
MAQITPLRRRMIDDMTVRNLSPATQQSYVYAVAKFSRFFARSPDQLGVEEVRAYPIHLAACVSRGRISIRCRARCASSSA